MPGVVVIAHYLAGNPGGVDGAPQSVEIPCVFQSEDQARSHLGVVMILSEMVHGELVAKSTSWYLQKAALTSSPVPGGDGDVYLGYFFEDDLFHPIAGGFDDPAAVRQWEPFVHELERQRAHDCGLPWRREMLNAMTLNEFVEDNPNYLSSIRFRPLDTELLVRPLDIYVTEPMF